MKKRIIVVALVIVALFTCSFNQLHAADYPVKEISGVVKDVKIKTPESD